MVNCCQDGTYKHRPLVASYIFSSIAFLFTLFSFGWYAMYSTIPVVVLQFVGCCIITKMAVAVHIVLCVLAAVACFVEAGINASRCSGNSGGGLMIGWSGCWAMPPLEFAAGALWLVCAFVESHYLTKRKGENKSGEDEEVAVAAPVAEDDAAPVA